MLFSKSIAQPFINGTFPHGNFSKLAGFSSGNSVSPTLLMWKNYICGIQNTLIKQAKLASLTEVQTFHSLFFNSSSSFVWKVSFSEQKKNTSDQAKKSRRRIVLQTNKSLVTLYVNAECRCSNMDWNM